MCVRRAGSHPSRFAVVGEGRGHSEGEEGGHQQSREVIDINVWRRFENHRDVARALQLIDT